MIDRCNNCPHTRDPADYVAGMWCCLDGVVLMTLQHRLMLFILSALALVICPAVMVGLFHTISEVAPNATWVVLLIGVVPVGLVMITCFIGLFYSIFRSRSLPL